MHPGLLADILEHPDDDTPRLVLADWLDEHGQEARAEFIRVQCRLAGMGGYCDEPLCSDCGPLHARERELLIARSLMDWLAPSPFPGPCYCNSPDDYGWVTTSGVVYGRAQTCRATLRRGFVEEVECICQQWLKHGPELVRQQPIRRVRLSDKRPWRGHFGLVAETIPPECRGKPFWLWESFRHNAFADSMLPWSLYQHLDQSLTRWHRQYASEDAAYAALSRACLTWAKQQEPVPCGSVD